ncbi:hypothetical protein CPB85DRAFT_540986 [Mucidula mucida]|nr:hypothetical protein CPB85DRAFT_540670 [Mucidula mucida]KAF8875555.1 hypothetical protein CPB85DRAFT_540986 [Mucidula mucida]
MAYSSSDYTLFSSSSSLNPSPLITVPLADLFLGNPIRNRCLIPIPDMLEADDGASTSLTPRKRTNGTKRKTSQIVAGFYTSQDEVMDASVEDAMDSDHSEEDCDSDVEEMEVAGWMVLTPSKRPLRRPITPISSGSRPFIPTERRSDEESDDEQLAEEDINLERIKRNRIDKGKARAMDTDPPIHLNQLGASETVIAMGYVLPSLNRRCLTRK